METTTHHGPQVGHQTPFGNGGQIADRLHSVALQGRIGCFADSPQAPDRKRMQELQRSSVGTWRTPSGLAESEASLARSLLPAIPAEDGMPMLSRIRVRIDSAISSDDP